MKIIQLTAENIKKLKVVDITPKKDFIEITGKNGSGKTSVLDSIWWALAGADAIQEQPIRQGQEKAIIKLDLGEMVVTRRFTKAGTTLSIENAQGFKAPSPQAILDAIIGNLAFDPLEFSRMPAKQQFEILRGIADIKLDFDALAKEDAGDTEKRRDINRDIKNLEGELAGIPLQDNAPDEPVDVKNLLEDLDRIEETNAILREQEIEQENLGIERNALAKRIEVLKTELSDAEIKLAAMNVSITAFDQIAYQSTDAVKAKIAGAESLNRAFATKQRRASINAQVALKQKASNELTAILGDRAQQRLDAIKAATMPIDGLALGNGEVTFNEIPFTQLSAAEQLRISIAIAMEANPKLKVIRIKDGSLLDDESLRLIQEMAGAREYQVWIERVNSDGRVGIVMEDGEIKEVNDE